MRRSMICLLVVISMFGFSGYSYTDDTGLFQQKLIDHSSLVLLRSGEIFLWYLPYINDLLGASGNAEANHNLNREKAVKPMEALNQVKELYAANFEKVSDINSGEYYYKLPEADYYLVFEGLQPDGTNYLFHLYEFVQDEPETGIGHTVTYGWYTVNKETGEIQDNTDTTDYEPEQK